MPTVRWWERWEREMAHWTGNLPQLVDYGKNNGSSLWCSAAGRRSFIDHSHCLVSSTNRRAARLAVFACPSAMHNAALCWLGKSYADAHAFRHARYSPSPRPCSATLARVCRRCDLFHMSKRNEAHRRQITQMTIGTSPLAQGRPRMVLMPPSQLSCGIRIPGGERIRAIISQIRYHNHSAAVPRGAPDCAYIAAILSTGGELKSERGTTGSG